MAQNVLRHLELFRHDSRVRWTRGQSCRWMDRRTDRQTASQQMQSSTTLCGQKCYSTPHTL